MSIDAALRNPIGTHMTVGKGLVDALRRSVEAGYETLQVFVGNPRGWALSAGNPSQDAAFRKACVERGTRVFIHSPYLVNLGSPTEQTYLNSVDSVAHNLRRAAEIGAEGVVVHTGSYVVPDGVERGTSERPRAPDRLVPDGVERGTSERPRGPDRAEPEGTGAAHKLALRRVREALLPILEAIADEQAPWLLLEPTAGQGRSLCAGVEDLPDYLEALDYHPKAGICLDTCHVFAAGAPLDEPGGATTTVDRIVEIGGRDRLRLIHANDSMDVRGAFRDRHQKIGEGHIGAAAFRELFAHPATEGVPFILETPGSREVENPQLTLMRRLREEARRGART